MSSDPEEELKRLLAEATGCSVEDDWFEEDWECFKELMEEEQ